MRLGVLASLEGPRAVLIANDGSSALRVASCLPELATLPAYDAILALLGDRSLRDRLRDEAHEAEYIPLVYKQLLPPVAPRRIIGVGLNYRCHAAAVGREPGEVPFLFVKDPGALASPFSILPKPPVSNTLDYEAELAVVIGRPDVGTSKTEVCGAVGGYAVANDLTLRNLARPETLYLAKGFEGACPLGPWITTPDEAGDAAALSIRSSVNGELRQNGSTADMIFGIADVLSLVSRSIALRPGDVLLTGSPKGTGSSFDPPRWLDAGDVVEAEIEGLGRIRTEVA